MAKYFALLTYKINGVVRPYHVWSLSKKKLMQDIIDNTKALTSIGCTNVKIKYFFKEDKQLKTQLMGEFENKLNSIIKDNK